MAEAGREAGADGIPDEAHLIPDDAGLARNDVRLVQNAVGLVGNDVRRRASAGGEGSVGTGRGKDSGGATLTGTLPAPLPMRPFGRLLLLFLAVPIAELALLVWIGGRVGVAPTLALVVATALAGSWLMRREGRGAWRRLQERLAAGQLPGREALDGLIVLVAGTLLLTPGVLTDVVGLLGLLPPSRAWIRRRLEARLTRALAEGQIRAFTTAPFGRASGPIEDAEVVDDTAGPRRADRRAARPVALSGPGAAAPERPGGD